MSKSIQLRDKSNEKCYPHPYYPVGSIYLSVNDTNPSRWFGGTWVQIAKGRTLVGVDTNDTDFNTVQKTGGEKTHILNNTEVPATPIFYQIAGTPVGTTFHAQPYAGGGGSDFWQMSLGRSGQYESTMNVDGGGKAHNNLQPYFTCYIWCRTA